MKKKNVACSLGKGLDGREAARKAALSIVDTIGMVHPSIALTFYSSEYQADNVLAGLTSVLGPIPIWGFSTFSVIDNGGEQSKTVALILFWGKGFNTHVYSIINPIHSEDHIHNVIETIESLDNVNSIFLATNGYQGKLNWITDFFSEMKLQIDGCLSSGNFNVCGASQIGGSQAAEQLGSIMTLEDQFVIGRGYGHGWKDVGIQYQIDLVKETCLQKLNGQTPLEIYSTIFSRPTHSWMMAPLNELVRLYPLGIEVFPGSNDHVIRAPLKIEEDGSFLMNAPLTEGQVAHLLVGNIEECVASVYQAYNQALVDLDGARPLLVLFFIDIAWRYLFNHDILRVVDAIKSLAGDLPIMGAYTLGHISKPSMLSAPMIHNQHIQIIILGEKENSPLKRAPDL